MESVNTESDLKKIIKTNKLSIDNKNYYLTKAIKFLLNFILTFVFIDYLLGDINENKFETVLAICTFSSVLFYILDLNFPSCSINLDNL